MRPLPAATAITRGQWDGRDCVWCRASLSHGAQSAGIARGSVGAVVLDIEVYACPSCAISPQTPAPPRQRRPGTGYRGQEKPDLTITKE